MLQKIPPARGVLKVSREKECFQFREPVRVAPRLKALEFKDKASGVNDVEEQSAQSRLVQCQLQTICEITSIMNRRTAADSAADDFEEMYSGIVYISRNTKAMETLKSSVKDFANNYAFSEFRLL